MGCNCGGSTVRPREMQSPRQGQTWEPPSTERVKPRAGGPGQPGYTYDGPRSKNGPAAGTRTGHNGPTS